MKKINRQHLDKIDSNLKNLHPRYQLTEIFKIVGKIGTGKFLYGAGYGRERDLLIGCMFALYCKRIQNREWFIQRVLDPPDFALLAATDRPIKERPFDYAEVEIVEIPSQVKGYSEVLKILNSTKLNWRYRKAVDNKTTLLIFINNTNGPKLSDQLIKLFKESDDPFGQVFVIYLLAVNPQESFVYDVKSLRPEGSKETLKLDEEIKKPIIWHPYFDRFAAKIE